MQISLSKSEYQALLRQDLYAFTQRCFCELNPTTTFKHNWHLEMLSSALEACRRKVETRLIINQPPRSLKSHCVSVAFVAFMLGHDPCSKIICVSYSQDLQEQNQQQQAKCLNGASEHSALIRIAPVSGRPQIPITRTIGLRILR